VKRRRKQRKIFYRTNWQIRAPNVRLINNQGKQIGIVSIQEARKIAQKEKLDLVEIAPRATPPVVKITGYAKFKYEQNKKEREARKKNKRGEKLKEIRLTPFIGKADLNTRIERAKKFAKEGDRLKIVLRFLGRQIIKKEFGYQLLDEVKEQLKDFYEPEGNARLSGKRLIMSMKIVKKREKDNGKKKNQSNQEKDT